MADTRVASGLTVEQWDDKFFTEYLTENRFSGEMGTNESNIIQVKENLTKKRGEKINFALVNKLTNAATTGRQTMEGNEEELVSRSYELAVDLRRNAVRVGEIDEQYSAIDLREAAKVTLKEWSMKDTESLLIQGLASINGVKFADSTSTQRNAWLTDNTDRVYFASGYAGATHASGLTELDITNDKLTAADITAMKYKALVTASPKIRPIRSKKNGRHYFILYVDPRCFRDLKAESSSPIIQAQREVSLELENDRLFQGGDMLWDGVIIKEVHEMYAELVTPFTNVGDGATVEVGCAFLCGAQALGVAYGRRWKTVTEDFDYGKKHGVEVSSIYGRQAAATDVIKMCKLPRGAVVTGAMLRGDALASGATAASQSMVLNIGVDASITTALGTSVTTASTSTALASGTIPNGAAVANVKDAGYNWPLGGLIVTEGPFELQDDGTVYITVVASAGAGSFVSGTLTLLVDYVVK